MSRTPKSRLRRPFFEAAAEEAAEQCREVPADLVSRCLQRFCDGYGPVPSEIRHQLDRIAYEFAMERSIAPYLGKPGPQKELLKQLRDGGDLNDVLPALAPEYRIALAQYLRPDDADWLLNSTDCPDGAITRLRRAAGKLWSDFEPQRGRAVDLPLETAVRSLSELLAPLLGHAPLIHANKNNDKSGPTPKCAGAKLINDILRGIDARLTTTAIMNMLARVTRDSEASPDPLLRLMEANPINHLDACLLPGRQAAIEELRADPFFGFPQALISGH